MEHFDGVVLGIDWHVVNFFLLIPPHCVAEHIQMRENSSSGKTDRVAVLEADPGKNHKGRILWLEAYPIDPCPPSSCYSSALSHSFCPLKSPRTSWFSREAPSPPSPPFIALHASQHSSWQTPSKVTNLNYAFPEFLSLLRKRGGNNFFKQINVSLVVFMFLFFKGHRDLIQ